MNKYRVRVLRTGLSETYIEVHANTPRDAQDVAVNEVADVDFTEYDQEKTVEPNGITQI